MVQSNKIGYNKDIQTAQEGKCKMQNGLLGRYTAEKGLRFTIGCKWDISQYCKNQQKRDDLKYVSPETYGVTISL